MNVPPEPFELPFHESYNGIWDAKGRVVAEVSDMHGNRSELVKYLLEAIKMYSNE